MRGRPADVLRKVRYYERIVAAAEDLAAGLVEWHVIESLAGMFWPQVKADIEEVLRAG